MNNRDLESLLQRPICCCRIIIISSPTAYSYLALALTNHRRVRQAPASVPTPECAGSKSLVQHQVLWQAGSSHSACVSILVRIKRANARALTPHSALIWSWPAAEGPLSGSCSKLHFVCAWVVKSVLRSSSCSTEYSSPQILPNQWPWQAKTPQQAQLYF